jgi:exodeoxyribonuclease V gamma subunit
LLHIHRAERADRLLDALAEVVAEPLDDPLQPETVAVPTRGIERWVTQGMSHVLGTTVGRADGVCANVSFPFPGRLVGGAVATATGIDRDTDPWRTERAVWPLLEEVDARLEQPWLATLAAHLSAGGEGSQGHRFSLVRHLADLYDRYAIHRPDMVRAWADGRDEDGAGNPVPKEMAWQAQLWRCLRYRIDRPSPAERLPDACERLRQDAELLDWPRRVSLFGLTRLPASFVQALHAIAEHRDVHLFLLHPSPGLWARVADAVDELGAPRRRSQDHTAGLPSNPLLRSWGRDAREMQLVIAGFGGTVAEHHRRADLEAATLLQRLQADVHADRLPPGAPLPDQPDRRAPLAKDDNSVQVHACHGRARQVEVVRDAVLHLLDSTDGLEPRDVIVMCPDIDAFAPLIHAAFGAVNTDEEDEDAAQPGNRPPGLRVRLADRSLRQTNPLLAVVARLLELAQSRVSASEVIDLAGRDLVRRRFRFDDDDLARIEAWIPAAGIRWGIDAAHRAPFELDAVDANTWRAGLKRILVGAAMAQRDGRLLRGVLPVDDVESGDIDLAGRFAELVDRLAGALDSLQGDRPIHQWVDRIAEAADALTAAGPAQAWQRGQLARILDDVSGEAEDDRGASAVMLGLAEVRALLTDRLRGHPTTANFRTGHLTICTMVPMRSVPHRVVCLLGLDDREFPRRSSPDGDDLLARTPHVGDRDPRTEDRQLLLDALLAARDHLVITYAGRSERTNERRPPAVPVGELLDVIDATVATGRQRDGVEVAAREEIVVEHPLQPFDDRSFRTGYLVPDRPWSFDEVALAGARALAGPSGQRPRVAAGVLDPLDDDVIEVDELVRFLQHPARAFLRHRLGIRLADGDDEPADNMPVWLSPLEQWAVGQRLLEARLSGSDAATSEAAERARGSLPPGALAEVCLRHVRPTVEELVTAAQPHGTGDFESLEVNLRLPDGRSVVGSVPGVHGDCILAVFYSRLGAKHRLATWVRLLTASACHPQRSLRAVTIGRAADVGTGVSTSVMRLPGDDAADRRQAALDHLAVVVDLYDRGMRECLLLYCGTSEAYARAQRDGRNAVSAGRRVWESRYGYDGEDKDAEHDLVLGREVPFDELIAMHPTDDEAGEGWPVAEPGRFGRYAVRLWAPLLAAEQRGSS